MSTGALIMMIGWQGLITLIAGYFFWRVLTSKPKSDNPVNEDSYADNDQQAQD
jgi:hypothetical protein